MEIVIAAVVAGVMGILGSWLVAWMNKRNAQVAIDAAVYTRSEAHLNNIIAQQDKKLSEQYKLIREQDVKIDQLEQNERTLKIKLFDSEIERKKLEVRIDDLEKKVLGF